MRFSRSLPLALLPLLSACSSDPKVLNLDIVTGHETDAMTRDPEVVRVTVTGKTPEGEVIEAEAAPGGELDFGEVDGDLAYSFEVAGLDGAGNTVMRGRSIGGLVLNGVSGGTIPLFVQRVGTWARPPGQLPRSHSHAPAATVGERYLFLTGGDAAENAAESEQYDLFAWAGAPTSKPFSFAAKSLVSEVTAVLAIGKEATWFDGTNFVPASLPEGLATFEEVAGGATVFAPDGRAFVVGASRAEKPTKAVLEVALDGTLSVRRLNADRAGAATLWFEGVGLVVIGGSASEKGVEVLSEQGTTFVLRDFPPDATAGAGAAVVTQLDMIGLAGGVIDGAAARTRLLDPSCKTTCTVKVLDAATLPVSLTRVAAFGGLSGGRAIAVGDEVDPAGTTRTFVIDYLDPGFSELLLREPRRGATVVPTPIGTLALLGGVHPDGTDALTVEMYFPE